MKNRWPAAFAVAALVSACAKGDAPATDTAAAPAAAAMPAPATIADFAGDFDWVLKAEVGDSVLSTGTAHTDASGAGYTLNAARPTDTVRFESAIAGDSLIQSSKPYTDPAMPKGVGQVTFRYAGAATVATEWSGLISISPAAKADTVIMRARVEVKKR